MYPVKNWVEKNLIELLNLNSLSLMRAKMMPSPHNYESTKLYLIKLNLWGRVTIFFVTCFLPKKQHVNWIQCDDLHQSNATVLEAFTGKSFKLAFATYTPNAVTHFGLKKGKKVNQILSQKRMFL